MALYVGLLSDSIGEQLFCYRPKLKFIRNGKDGEERKKERKEKKRKKCLNASKVGVRQRRRNECLYGWKRWGDLSQLCSLLTETVAPKRIFNSMRTTPQRKREKMHCSSSRVVLLSRPGNVWRFLSLHLLFHLRLIPLGIANYHSPRLREREKGRGWWSIPVFPLSWRLVFYIPFHLGTSYTSNLYIHILY